MADCPTNSPPPAPLISHVASTAVRTSWSVMSLSRSSGFVTPATPLPATCQVALVQLFPFRDLFDQFRPNRLRQHDDAVLVPLARPHVDRVAFHIHVLHAQPAALHQPQTGTVEKLGHQPKQPVRSDDA